MQKCVHCGSTVIAPHEMFYSGSQSPFADVSSSLTGRALKIAEIQQLIHDGRKIEAIKVFRETFGSRLKEAKDAVEAIERGESIDISGMRVQVNAPTRIKVDGEIVKKAGLAVGGTMIAMFVIPMIIVLAVVAFVLYFTVFRADAIISNASKNTTLQTPTSGAKSVEASPAQEQMRIGGDGNGPGRFKDNRSVAVDGNGRIYSSDYSPFKIQVFDAEGKFINQWKPEDGDNLYGLAADRAGNIYVANNKGLFKYEGEKGKLLAKAEGINPRGITITWDNKVIVAAGRGINIYDAELKIVTEIKDAAERASSTFGFESLAVDGSGTIFAVERSSYDICKFSADGKFLNRFPSGANSPNGIVIDISGRLFVSETSNIKVLDSSGKAITSFSANQAFGLALDQAGDLYVASRPFVIKYKLDL